MGELRRSLGLLDASMFGVGAVVGAGTYAIIGEATGLAGSMIWLSLLLAAVTALLTALVYGELVSRHPDAGGGYEFIAQAFGRRFANGAAVLLFATSVIAAATIAIAFSQYLGRLADVPLRLVAPGTILLMGIVNVLGIRGASWFNVGATVVAVAGLVAVAIAAVPDIGSRSLNQRTDAGWAGVVGGAAMAFFAYVGFEDAIKSAEETKRPRTTLPRALLISGIAVLLINVAIGVASVSVLPWQDLAGTEGPLSQVLASQWGDAWGVALTGAALVAMSKTILSNVLGGSRLVFDVGRDTALPRWLAYVWDRTGTPVTAIVIATALAMALSLIGELGTVATMSNLAVLSLFLIVNVALVRIRRLDRDSRPSFYLPWNIAGVSVLNILSIGLVVLLGVFNVLYLL